jgi:aminoglycoside phosphotransferase (APT) family kinase protein
MRWPDAEVPINEDLVRQLLDDQHPELSRLPLQLCDAGWDNVMWRLGADLAVRMPRRQIAAPLIVNEQRWLPELAVGLPLATPVPLYTGRPTRYYPWHWSVVPWLEGAPGDRTPPTDPEATAEALARFLAAMHRPAPVDAPYNPYRSGPVGGRRDTFEERLSRLADRIDGPAIRKVWEAGASAPAHPGPPLWVHGDLHPANTLVHGGHVVAVIDFGDLCAGDPAVDLGAAYLSLTDRGIERFWAAYGETDPALVRRSLGWAALFSLMLYEIGLEGRPTYADVGRAALDRLSKEPAAG